jgi:DNA/RNA endonuclease YhcR with UshA esterase domain
MKTLILPVVLSVIAALGFAAGTESAAAQTIQPADAPAHVGQTVTVEGDVSNVHKVAAGVTFIDMGGRYPDNTFTAVILPDDAKKFPDVNSLNGKTVDVTGAVRLYKGKPEILLTDAAQIKAK